MQTSARGPLASAWTELIADTVELSVRCGVSSMATDERGPFVSELESMPADASPIEALRLLRAVINCSRQMEDFSPAQVRRLTAYIHRWVTPQNLTALPWDFVVVLCNKLVYALLAYESERTDADWELAELCGRLALSLMENHAPDDIHFPDAIDMLGTVLLNRRNTNRSPRLREAESLFKRNLEVAPRHKNFHEQKRALLNLGILNQELSHQEPGRRILAIEYYDELETLNKRCEPEERIHGQVLTNRGWALIMLPRDRQPDGCKRAVRDFVEAVAAYRKDTRQSAHLAYALMHLGLAQSQLDAYEHDQHEAALRSFDEAKALFCKLGIKDGYARVVHNLGLHWMHRGEHQKALDCYSEALHFRRGSAIEEWETLGNIVDVRIQPELPEFGSEEGDDELLRRLDELTRQLSDHGDTDRALRAHYYGLQLLGHGPHDAADEVIFHRAERAISQAETVWSAIEDSLVRYHVGRWLGTFYAARMLLGIRRGESTDLLLRFAQSGKARTLLLERQRSRGEQPCSVDSAVLAKRLRQSPQTAFIEIGISSLGTAALVAYLGGDGEVAIETRELDIREEELVGLLTKPNVGWLWRLDALRNADEASQLDKLEACTAGMEHILGILHERLLGPVTAGLRSKGVRDLVFAVHGPLAAFPLAAAWRTADGEPRYLIEEFRSISLSPSITSFVYAEQPRQLKSCQYVLGNTRALPKEANRDGLDLEALWRRSAQTAPALKNPSPEEFLQSLEQVDLVHAVCHGEFDPWRLDRSGIQVGDALLSCDRLLAESRPTQTAMVVLCACRSGRSRSEDFGAEWLGLSGVLLRRGVQSVLAALWDVDYAASFHISRAFYQHLFGHNQPAAIAASEAMREVLHAGRNARRSDDAHWFLDGREPKLIPRLRRLLDSPWFWSCMQLVNVIPST